MNLFFNKTILGDNSHARAVQSSASSAGMVKAREAAISKSKAAIISTLRNVYFAAVNYLANALITKLNDLSIDQVYSYDFLHLY